MKLKISGGLLSVLILVLTILLFVQEESTTKIVVSPKIYSIMKSSENESFKVNILTNDVNSFFFNQDYITNALISSENDEIIPIDIKKVVCSNVVHIYNNESYYFVTFELLIGFNSEDYSINIDKAQFELTYSNSQFLKLHIGEFNYLFSEDDNTDLAINNLLSTHDIIDGIDTSSGLFLNLVNLSNSNITISKIELGSKDVLANNFYLTEVFNDVSFDALPKDILLKENYNYKIYGDTQINPILLKKNSDISIYVPFSYVGEIPFLHRFYVKVLYFIDGEERTFVIDDFPYINTTDYKTELESRYELYEFEN